MVFKLISLIVFEMQDLFALNKSYVDSILKHIIYLNVVLVLWMAVPLHKFKLNESVSGILEKRLTRSVGSIV